MHTIAMPRVIGSDRSTRRRVLMTDFQADKAVVRALYADLSGATPGDVGAILARHTHPDWHWRGMHPFHEQHGAEAVARTFWAPFLTAMIRVQRRPDIFMAGLN